MILSNELPCGWKICDLPELLFFQEGPGVRKWQFTDSGVKLLNVRNLVDGKLQLDNTKRFLSEEEAFGKYSHFLAEAGDLVMATSGVTWGKIAWVEEKHLPLCMNTSTVRFRPLNDREMDPSYMEQFLKSVYFTRQIDRVITGSAQPNFGPSHLSKIKIPLPPLSEQQRIADILNQADAIRQTREQIRVKAASFRGSLFCKMFGDPIVNPMNWKTKPFGELANNQDGRRKPVKASDRKEMQGEYPYYGASGIIDYVDSFLFNEPALLIGEDGANLLARSTPIAFIAKGKYWVNNHAHVVTQNSAATLGYLETHLNLRSVRDFITGSAQPKLNQKNLNRIPVPCPPTDLQEEFDLRVAEFDKIRATQEASSTETESLLNSLVQRAFRGEL